MVWIVGSKGMLGWEIAEQLTKLQVPFTGSGSEVNIENYSDIENFVTETERSSYLSSHTKGDSQKYGKVQWIVNCAAFTDVDRAETEEEKAYLVNCKGAKNLALFARNHGCRLVHISTNYVFNGKTKIPYTETSPKDPLNVYGKTKSEAEDVISKTMTQYFIIRTSWLYGFHGRNFVYAMSNLMNDSSSLQVINDQFASPTSCQDLAHFIITLIEKTDNAKSLFGKNSSPANGIYHYANSGETSLYEFALAIYHYGTKHGKIKNSCTIEPCPASEYQTAAVRPDYAVLDTTKVSKNLKVKIPNWKASLEQFIKSEKFSPTLD